jgi:hypothetical protein
MFTGVATSSHQTMHRSQMTQLPDPNLQYASIYCKIELGLFITTLPWFSLWCDSVPVTLCNMWTITHPLSVSHSEGGRKLHTFPVPAGPITIWINLTILTTCIASVISDCCAKLS